MTPLEMQTLSHKLNMDLSRLATYHNGMPMHDLGVIFSSNGLDFPLVQSAINNKSVENDQVHVEVMPGLFFTMAWQLMESGRFEIVSYFSSIHDDYREPYTLVMKGAEKRKLVKKLNDVLWAITTNYYFASKSVAMDSVRQCLKNAGFDYYEFEDAKMPEDEGRFNVCVGNNVYLSMTWHRMESDRYEIVAYAN